MVKKCKIIAIVNQKGGVGKTTTTYNLACELARKNKKVLLVDFDSQANLTMQAGIFRPDQLERTIANLMSEFIERYTVTNANELIIKSNEIDLIPANVDLAGLELALSTVTSRETVLADVLEHFREQYDYILIDCSPSLGLLPVNALAAADSVIIPVSAQFWAVKGMETLLTSINRIKHRINRQLDIEGVLITMYDKRYLETREMQETVEKIFSENIPILKTKIPEAIKMRETASNAVSARELIKTVKNSKPLNAVVEAYEQLAIEVIENNK